MYINYNNNKLSENGAFKLTCLRVNRMSISPEDLESKKDMRPSVRI